MSVTRPVRSFLSRPAVPPLLLCLLVFLAYLGTFPGHFFLDDGAIVRDNPLVADPDLRRIFLSDYWGEVESGLYRPLTILSYAVNRLLLGPGPAGFHAVNVALHACAALLLCGFLSSLGLPRTASWLTASLFALHPVNTESVNVVVGRAELLTACFVFLALWAATARPPLHGAWTGLCYLAGLLCKEHAVTFVALLPLVDLFEGGRRGGWKSVVRKRAPLYALLAVITAAWLLLRSIVLPSDQPLFAVDNPLVSVSLPVRILTALKVQLLYLGKLLVPLRLQAMYTGASVPLVESLFSPWGAAAVLALPAGAVLGLHGWRRARAYGLGIALYAASFAVTANILFVTAVFMAERFAYLPSAWFCLALVSLVSGEAGPGKGGGRLKTASALGLAAAGLSFLLLTVHRNGDYRSPVHLWESAVAADPRNVKAWMALGEAYWEEGRREEAERALVAATESDPSFPDSYALLGEYLLRLGRPAEAIEAARKGGDGPLANLVLARGHLLLGRPAEALAWLARVRPVPALRDEYWLARGEALERTGDDEGAAEAYRQLSGSSGYRRAAPRHGLVLLRLGRPEEAEGILRQAAAEAPAAATLNLLGIALAEQGRAAEAREYFSRAMKLDPASPEYRRNYERASGPQR